MISRGDTVVLDGILTEKELEEACVDVGYVPDMWEDYQSMLKVTTENAPLLVQSVYEDRTGVYGVRLSNRIDDSEIATTWAWPVSIFRKVSNPYVAGKPVKQIAEFNDSKLNGILRVEFVDAISGKISIVGSDQKFPYHLFEKARIVTSEIV